LPANSLATRSVAGKARSYIHGLLAETMTKANAGLGPHFGQDWAMVLVDAASATSSVNHLFHSFRCG
jgi:hypothetical protein